MSAELEEIETGESDSTPLVLIHDGGGTIFQYYLLGPFERQTYAIANPYFHDKARPVGGIPELAKAYLEAIRSTLRTGSFIIGGWSFGGVISLEIVRLLSDDTNLKVAGLLLIDTFCPWRAPEHSLVRPTPTFRDTTSQEMKDKVLASFSNARSMVSEWKQPEFTKLPPAVLVRAADADEAALGWSAFPALNITNEIDVPGDHFSMFSEDRLEDLTRNIRKACSLLD